jgi:ribulose kinase
MSVVTCPIDLTCKFIYLQKYVQKRRIFKRVKKVNDVIYSLHSRLFDAASQIRKVLKHLTWQKWSGVIAPILQASKLLVIKRNTTGLGAKLTGSKGKIEKSCLP